MDKSIVVTIIDQIAYAWCNPLVKILFVPFFLKIYWRNLIFTVGWNQKLEETSSYQHKTYYKVIPWICSLGEDIFLNFWLKPQIESW